MTAVVLAGHPFASTGMGEQFRSHVAALLAVGVPVRVFDLFGNVAREDPELVEWLAPLETHELGSGIRVFHINGDEVEPTRARLLALGADFEDGTNVVVPAWELPVYPSAWVPALRGFDEVWALSRMIAHGLKQRGVGSHYVGQSVQPRPGPMLPRRHFGISESATVFLSFCDLSSYATRKNPQAALDLIARLRQAEPLADLQLVLKVKDAEGDAESFVGPLRADHPDVLFVSDRLSGLETRSLINACDCLVSLHRAEGFGRTAAEAMWLGRVALATGWSGNLDYMTRENSLLIDHAMIDIRGGDYPHSLGQMWADPDLDHATALARLMLRERARLAPLAARGRQTVQARFSHVAVGLRIAERIEALSAR